MNKNEQNIGFFSFYEIYNKQNAFLNPQYYSIGDGLEYPFVLLKEQLSKRNISINTLDVLPIEKYDKVIFTDFPSNNIKLVKKLYNMGIELYLILFESELIRHNNWKRENHMYFNKIFTWNDEWVDGKKYVKYYWPNKVPDSISFNSLKEKKLCVLIAGNKNKFGNSLELYSERIKAIRWFEENKTNDFDLFGYGWNYGILKKPFQFINKISFFDKVYRKIRANSFSEKVLKPFTNYFPSYKGSIASKRSVYSNYKFAICYENAQDIPGYVTEKIFDCFFGGSVPIYLGDNYISPIIPQGTFIDFRQFKSYSELYTYLSDMPDVEYESYIDSINDFIINKKLDVFNAEIFVQTIIENIV